MDYRGWWRRFSGAHPRGTGDPEAVLRSDAEAVLRAAIKAVDPHHLVAEALVAHPPPLPDSGRILVAGFGLAAEGMAAGLQQFLDRPISEGILVSSPGGAVRAPEPFELFQGGWPLPDQASVAGASAIRQLVDGATADDLVIFLVSGGGASLLTLPPAEVGVEGVRNLTDLLLRGGVSNRDRNRILRHVDLLKGGRLARLAAPARSITVAISNVAGASLDDLAGGPTCPDASRFADALDLLAADGLLGKTPRSVIDHLERGARSELRSSPKPGDPCFAGGRWVLVEGSETARRVALAEAERLGYEAEPFDDPQAGCQDFPHRDPGGRIRELAHLRTGSTRPSALVATRDARAGAGIAGNQALALAAVPALDGLDGTLMASMATSGMDGSGDAAGAIVTSRTMERALASGLRPVEALDGGDPYRFFDRLGDLIRSGPTGVDVGDLQVMLLS